MTEFNNFSNKDNLKQNNFNNCENAELDDKLNDCNIENNKNENSKSLKNDCNNDTDKIFSKNYFQHKFSKTYLKSGISNMWRKYTMFLPNKMLVLLGSNFLFISTTSQSIITIIMVKGIEKYVN